MLRHVLTLPCNGRRHYGLFTFQDSNIYKACLSKSSRKIHITVKNFDHWLFIFKTGSSFYKWLPVFRLPFDITSVNVAFEISLNLPCRLMGTMCYL